MDNTSYWSEVSTLSTSFLNEYKQEWERIAPLYYYGLADHEWSKHGTCAYACCCRALMM